MMVISSKLCAFYHQIIAGCSASLSALMIATLFGWFTPTLPVLLSADSEIPMTFEEASWAVSIPQLGSMVIAPLAGFLADHFGRKPTLLATTPIVLIGWGIILYFKTFKALFVARIIQSLALSTSLTVAPMYLGEIASPNYRGTVTSTFFACWWLGYLYEYILGSLLSFNYFTYVTALTGILFFIAFLWQPESPYFCLMQNDVKKAKQSLSWLRCTTEVETDQELDRIKQSVDEDQKQRIKGNDWMKSSTNRKAMIILFLIGFLRTFCGLIPLNSYAAESLTAEGDHFFISPDGVTVIMGVMMFVGSVCGALIIDLFKRTQLLFVSCSLSGIMMFSVGTFYYCKSQTSIDISSFTWVPPVCLIIFSAVPVIAIFPVSTAYTSELFDSYTRAKASGIMTMFTMFMGFIVLKFYLTISHSFGVFVNFYIFAIICFIGSLLSFSVMPETKGKSFEQIRIELSSSDPNNIQKLTQ